MKKILFIILSLLFLGNISYAYECDQMVLNAIKDNQIIDFNPTTKNWSRNLGLNDYVLRKQTFIGSGGFSEYVYKNQSFEPETTYEFLYYTKLLAYNAHTLKFYELGFTGDKFIKRELAKAEVQMLFPDVEILLVSEFKNNEIELEQSIYKKKAYMILNDTDRDFYKYQFEYYKSTRELFNNIFEINIPRILVFSHFKSRDEMFPILKIKIKPLFKIEYENHYQ